MGNYSFLLLENVRIREYDYLDMMLIPSDSQKPTDSRKEKKYVEIMIKKKC